MNEHEQKTPGDAILEKIRAGEVHMRPRFVFFVRALASALVALLMLALSSFIVSFILFSLRETGEAFLLGFGLHGIEVFLALFPWPLLSVDIALFFLLDYLLRGFSFGYKFSLVSVFLGILVASTGIALVINATAFHPFLLRHADRGELPVAGSLYEGVRMPHRDSGVFRGIVTSVASTSFVMMHDDHDTDTDDSSTTLQVFLSPAFAVLPTPGDRVFVLGAVTSSSTIEAEGLQVFPEEMK